MDTKSFQQDIDPHEPHNCEDLCLLQLGFAQFSLAEKGLNGFFNWFIISMHGLPATAYCKAHLLSKLPTLHNDIFSRNNEKWTMQQKKTVWV